MIYQPHPSDKPRNALSNERGDKQAESKEKPPPSPPKRPSLDPTDKG